MSMSDRELLQMAAKAFVGRLDNDLKKYFEVGEDGLIKGWNPLHDLGHAKNLRHVLHMRTGFDDRLFGLCAYATYSTGPDSCNSIMQSVQEEGGKRAAKRRAIVRAAAEIGKSMQESKS